MIDQIEYSYTVQSISEDGTVAQVVYTPADDRLKAVTRAVPIPLKKARDQEHAREILRQKCRQRAPLQEWDEALELLAGRKAADVQETVAALRSSVVGQEQRVEPPKPEAREERIRREFLAE